jgi:hypothetical protein
MIGRHCTSFFQEVDCLCVDSLYVDCTWYKVLQIPSYAFTKVTRQTGRQTNIQPHTLKIIASCSVTSFPSLWQAG